MTMESEFILIVLLASTSLIVGMCLDLWLDSFREGP